VTPTSLSLAAVLHAWFSQVVLLTFSGGGHHDMSSVHNVGVWERVRERERCIITNITIVIDNFIRSPCIFGWLSFQSTLA
jgi:hypothetical protein